MILYKITCLNTGKIYIGITGIGMTRRWNQHWANARRGMKSALYSEMRDIPKERWTIEAISEHIEYAALLAAEMVAIAALNATNPDIGYNRTAGGQGCLGLRFKKTPEQIEKSARFHRGKKWSPEHTERLRAQLARMLLRPRPSRKNPHRDAAIMAHYYSSPSLAETGRAFGIKEAATSMALKRCRDYIADAMTNGDAAYENFIAPHRIHPDHLEMLS